MRCWMIRDILRSGQRTVALLGGREEVDDGCCAASCEMAVLLDGRRLLRCYVWTARWQRAALLLDGREVHKGFIKQNCLFSFIIYF
jgi:hypothetical protein